MQKIQPKSFNINVKFRFFETKKKSVFHFLNNSHTYSPIEVHIVLNEAIALFSIHLPTYTHLYT